VPLIMAGYIVTRFLGVALHEIVGHGLAASLLGGSFYGVYVSPSAGFSYVFLPLNSGPWADAAVNLAGIGVELIVGLLIFLLYRRIQDGLEQLIALLFMEVLLFQAFLYMAFGAFPESGGDTSQVVQDFNSPALEAVFAVTGVALAAVTAYLITRRLLTLLAPTIDLRKWILIVAVFWLFPIPVDMAIEGVGPVPPWPAFVVAIAVAVAAGYIIGRRYRGYVTELPPTPVPPLGIAKRDTLALGIAFVMVFATWLAAFGPNTGSAHGVMLREPPIEAEVQRLGVEAINMHVHLLRTGNPASPINMSVEFRFRGIPDLQSPLDEQIWHTFDNRAYFPYYEAEAVALAEDAFNVTGWTVDSEGIDGTAWSQGHDYSLARNVTISLNSSVLQSILHVSGGNVTLGLHDPFKYPPPGIPDSYVDEVTFGWGAGLVLVNYSAHGGSTVADTITGELRWQNISYDAAPDTYFITIHLS